MAEDSRPKPPAAVWWLLGALGVLALATAIYGVRHFDDDLTQRSQEALRAAGIPVDVHFDGRHGYVSGTLEYEEDVAVAVDVVRNVRGVAHVEPEIDFLIAGGRERAEPLPTTPPSTSPELTFRIQDGVIQLRGRLATQEQIDAVVGAAEAAYGAGNVINDLTIGEGIQSPEWVDRLPGLFSGLGELPAGTVAFGPEGAAVSGTVDNEGAKDAIGGAVAAVVAPLGVNNRIEVIVPTPPSLVAAGESGVVTLRGAMPDQLSIDQIVAAAEDIYGSENVINEMTVGAGVQPADWLELAPGFFVRTVALDPWEIEIVDGSMTVFGRGPADGSVQAAIDGFAGIGGGLDVETSGLEVAAEAVATELTELLEGSATFETGSATLSDDAIDLLDQAIELLIANPSTVLIVEGHTDDQGDDQANLELSQARADAVVEYLVGGGVDASRLTAIGYGESRPVASNETEEGRAQNRRIEFIVEEGTN